MGLSDFIYFILGCSFTAAVSTYLYRKASNELKSETADLKNLMMTILSGLEKAGLANRQEDNKGNIIGYKLKVPGFPVEVKFGTPKLIVHPEEKSKEDNS